MPSGDTSTSLPWPDPNKAGWDPTRQRSRRVSAAIRLNKLAGEHVSGEKYRLLQSKWLQSAATQAYCVTKSSMLAVRLTDLTSRH